MKVTLERNHLLKSLSHVHRVVERRNTYPILANVLFKASDDKVELRATDLDIEVTESVPAMVSTPGTTTVPAHIPPAAIEQAVTDGRLERRSLPGDRRLGVPERRAAAVKEPACATSRGPSVPSARNQPSCEKRMVHMMILVSAWRAVG